MKSRGGLYCKRKKWQKIKQEYQLPVIIYIFLGEELTLISNCLKRETTEEKKKKIS